MFMAQGWQHKMMGNSLQAGYYLVTLLPVACALSAEIALP